jgi:hypothetical protein
MNDPGRNMGRTRTDKGRRKTGAALQAVGMLVMMVGLVYGVMINPMTPAAAANASMVMTIAALAVGMFILGFTILLAGAWMARVADARFGSV